MGCMVVIGMMVGPPVLRVLARQHLKYMITPMMTMISPAMVIPVQVQESISQFQAGPWYTRLSSIMDWRCLKFIALSRSSPLVVLRSSRSFVIVTLALLSLCCHDSGVMGARSGIRTTSLASSVERKVAPAYRLEPRILAMVFGARCRIPLSAGRLPPGLLSPWGSGRPSASVRSRRAGHPNEKAQLVPWLNPTKRS